MGKPIHSKPTLGVYRDEPDRDDAASTSSAVLMEDIDYPDADLPAYEDVVYQRGGVEEAADTQQEPQTYTIYLCYVR